MLKVVNPSVIPWMECYPTILSRPNDLLVQWRLAAYMMHFTFLIAVTFELDALLVQASLPTPHSMEDYTSLRESSELSLAVSYIGQMLLGFGILSARSLHYEVLNLLHAACHTAAGVLLMVVWRDTGHVARIWQIWFTFAAFPCLLELGMLMYIRRRGLFRWY